MSALYRNDKPGEFPPSYYAATATIPATRAKLQGDQSADVVILGAGFCGLWAALTCARAGLKTIVLDAHRAGFGASGRNGGQAGSAYNMLMSDLEKRLGQDKARALWDIAEDGKAQLKAFCADQAPEAAYKPGIAHGAWDTATAQAYQNEAEFWSTRYGYTDFDAPTGPEFCDIVKSPKYVGGVIDTGAGHLHPLNYALALAREAEAAGATIYELSEVTAIKPGAKVVMQTAQGQVTASHGIVAGNGYLSDIAPKVTSRTMPINSFIAATEPLGNRAGEILARDIAVADDKFVVNYFRLSEDKRLLFGGRENYSIGFPKDIGTRLRERMESLFPQIQGVGVDYTWGGTLGITPYRVPYVTRIGDNVMSAGGFSGHGVVLSGMAGRIMAEAVLGQAGRFDVMSELPCPKFPGGSALRAPILVLAMSWYSLRDRLGL